MQTNLAIVSTSTLSHEEWLDERRKGIGGSDAGAIMGANPWKTALSVYMDKLGLNPPQEETEAMRAGTDLEPYVADRFCEATGKRVRRCNKILQHKDYPWMIANIDRDVIGEDAGLECKTRSPLSKGIDLEAGEIPPSYYWQIQHYMAVTGASHWYLAIYVFGVKLHIFDVPRDDESIESLIWAEQDFWLNHVEVECPPYPTGADSDEDAVDAYCQYIDYDTLEAKDLSAVATELDLLEIEEAFLKKAERKVRVLKERIKIELGELQNGFTDRWNVTFKPNKKGARILRITRIRKEE